MDAVARETDAGKGRWALKIDIKELLGSVPAIQAPGVRIGWPDDPTPVDVADPRRFSARLDDTLRAFRNIRGGTGYLVNAEVNSIHSVVSVRFVQPGPCTDRDGKVEPELVPSLRSLRDVAVENGGGLHYWGGNNYFDLSLPFRGPMREEFPEVEGLWWDERYLRLLERAAWGSLRGMVFRFSKLAERIAAYCVESRLSSVLIPSVGLCVHPWLFADHGLNVVAADLAPTALAALSDPARWPRLYSREACERWDIEQSSMYASQGNPDRFARMPALEDRGVRETLGQRISFELADWADLPLGRGSVDAIFATNALPRDSADERAGVLKEWVRVVRPGGAVFIAQHNFFDSGVTSFLRDAGWVEVNLLGGERPRQPGAAGFELYLSSG